MLHALHDSNIGASMNGRVINNLRFADDIALLAESKEDLQTLVSDVLKSSSQLGLKISLSKIQVQVIGRNSTQIDIQIGNHTLEQVKSFIYLGGQIDEDGTSQNDVKRIGLALGTVHTLHPIWRARNISNQTKIALCKSLVLSIVLYAAETWTLKKEIKVDSSHLKCHASDEFWASAEGTRSVMTAFANNLAWKLPPWTEIKKRQLAYYGHIIRVDNSRLRLITIDGSTKGTGPRGRPPKRWTDNCKES